MEIISFMNAPSLNARGHSLTTLASFWLFFWPPTPYIDISTLYELTKSWHFLDYLPTSSGQRSLWMPPKGIDLYQSRPNQKCLDSDGSTCGKDSNQDAGYPVKRLKIVPNQSCQLVKKSRQSGSFCKILSKNMCPFC